MGAEISKSKRNLDLSAKRNAKARKPPQNVGYPSNAVLVNSQKRDGKTGGANAKTVTYVRNNTASNLGNFKSEKNQYFYPSQKGSKYGVSLKYATTTGQGVDGYRVKNSQKFGYKHFNTVAETSKTGNKQA